MIAKPKTIDEYLPPLSDDKRAVLEKLCKNIKAVVPKTEECISYSLPAFRLNRQLIVCFGAAAKHSSFYPMSAATVEAHSDDLKSYDSSLGTIHISADKPLPTALVRKIVKARITENETKGKQVRGNNG